MGSEKFQIIQRVVNELDWARAISISFGESGGIMWGMRQLSSSMIGPELIPSPVWAFRLRPSFIVGRFRLAIGVGGKTKDSS
jgi:hypothetical protein